ncbi:MAG: hypothetical protein ACJ748_09730, partial [Flavisolibacter sp.]
MKNLFLFILGMSLITALRAQLPVRFEPLHHNVLENSYVRLLDVRIPPHDTSQIHIHETPSIFVIIDNVKTGSQIIKEGNNPAGNAVYNRIWFDGFTQGPRIHRVWNSDTSLFHVMDIELLHKDPVEVDPLLPDTSLELLFNQKLANGYLLVLNENKQREITKRKTPLLLIVLDNTYGHLSVNGRKLNKGDFIFFEENSDIKIVNYGAHPIRFGL